LGYQNYSMDLVFSDMPVNISCPNCDFATSSDASKCPNCGVNLGIAAILAEQALATSSQIPSGAALSPEILIPRLGDYLLERGLVTSEELQRALDYQAATSSNGKPRLLGQTLLDLRLIDREELDQVITEQILQLQAALQDSNRHLEKRVQERTNELQKALNRLTELNQLKSNFISSISHELRTPLTHIKGYLDLLVEGSLGPINTDQADAFNVLLRAEARLEQLIDDLIRFSLAARGELSLSMTTVSLQDLINISVARADKLARPRNISIKVESDEQMPLVQVDSDKIVWVLLQLLDNAIKFTPQGGTVIFKTSSGNKIATIAITDTGIGIPPERLNEIFEPFHQLEGADTRRFGGTGLGLALVRRILDAHGSTISVRSKVNQGSSFEFYLPVAQENHV
jgi:signal transduction histidine kinase